MRSKTVKDLLLLSFISITSTLVLWLPFLLHLESFWGMRLPENGFETIKRNYDGLNYIIVAKSLYDPPAIASFNQELGANYFAAHFPGYPLAIRLVSPLFGYLNGMLIISLLSSVAAVWAFYLLLREVGKGDRSAMGNWGNRNEFVWLGALFLLVPARWLVVHSVGSPEPMFVAAVLFSFLFFLKALREKPVKHFLISALFGTLAVLTRSPGILLFIGYGLYLLLDSDMHARGKFLASVKKFRCQSFSLLLIPLTLVGIFSWYGFAYGDFLAYFHSGDNIHLTFPPFQVFSSSQAWVGDIWLEDILFYFTIYATTLVLLLKQRLYPFACFVLIYFLATISVAHRDIARYSLPLAPFALIAFRDLLVKKEAKIVFAIVVVAVYLYAINFAATNTFPTADLMPYE